jgi:hypothetical protein
METCSRKARIAIWSACVLHLLALTTLAEDYPVPKPAQDTSQYGRHFQRTMTLMATSTPQQRHTVRILFYGQSIIGQGWHKMVVEDLKRRFPHTDFVVTNKALGGFGSPFLVRTLHYDVIPFYPDLMVFHVYGPVDKYEELIREIRSRTTAEIIMQSDHAHKWPGDTRENHHTPFAGIAQKYGCSWQPQRWEWVDYLRDNQLEPTDLLRDEVHLNEHGRWLMAELLKRYMVYLPDEPQAEWKDTVQTFEVGKDVHWQDDKLTLAFVGNRVVALAASGAAATTAVLIDGKKPTEHPECYTFTRPSGTPKIGWPAIKKIIWRKPLLLESWEATCRDFNDDHTEFAFSVEGSETGFDGTGKASETFISNSGRIVIEPEDWVFEFDRRVGNKDAPNGFKVRWQVELLGTDTYATPEVADPTREYPTVLASGLENAQHTLELIAENGGKPAIKAIVVYRPPIGR